MIPLFLTPMSLSSQSAIGVQTKLMLEHFSDWRHLYWDARDFAANDPRSVSAESFLFTHFTLLKHEPPSRAGQVLCAAGLSWWNRNQLKKRYAERILHLYENDVDAVYAAPCSVRDSTRMRSILGVLKKPFVLHLWDLLDPRQSEDKSFRWLLDNATKVLCVSEPLIELLSPMRPDAAILRFHRNPSSHQAAAPTTGPLRIALIGNCRRYPHGLTLLHEALRLVRERGIQAEVVYIGTKSNVKTWGSPLSDSVKITGFISSDHQRDEALAQCHVGFIPGPLEDPSRSMLSRYSIPSRILDYMATGMPILAAVHPSSATALFLRASRLADCIQDPTPYKLAESLHSLYRTEIWHSYSDMSKKAFQGSQTDFRKLRNWLEQTAHVPLRS